MFLHPLFSFAHQFLIIPPSTCKVINQGLQKLIRGPSHWLPTPIAIDLKTLLKHPLPPRDIQADNHAAMLRVITITLSTEQLEYLSEDRSIALSDNSIAGAYTQTLLTTQKANIDPVQIIQALPNSTKKKPHKIYYNKFLQYYASQRNSTNRLLDRLKRWQLPIPNPITHYQTLIKKILPLAPRVHLAFISLLLNGWHTFHRFQQIHHCLFCELETDRIEHYTKCQIIKEVYQYFQIPHDIFLINTPPNLHKASLYILYTLQIYHHQRRHNLPKSPSLPLTISRLLMANHFPLLGSFNLNNNNIPQPNIIRPPLIIPRQLHIVSSSPLNRARIRPRPHSPPPMNLPPPQPLPPELPRPPEVYIDLD